MATVLEQYNSFINSGDSTIRQLFFIRSIKPMLSIIIAYVLFVLYIGPAWMKNRKPFQLRKLIVLYNFALVFYYSYFLLKGLYFMYWLGWSVFCHSIADTTKNPLVFDLYLHGYVMYLVRYVELIDTVFLVLSKKFKMITALHVFHHCTVPIFGWFGFRSEKGTYLAGYMGVNSFVHIIMYSYYAVAALGPEYQKYLWWKKYLTTLQISQFFVVTCYLILMYAFGCVQSKFIVIGTTLLCILFFFWFIDYYRRIFGPATKEVTENGSVQQNKSVSQNGLRHRHAETSSSKQK